MAVLLNYQQREGAKLEASMMKNLQEITRKIESFGKIFSEKNGIDILMGYTSGQQFNYINPQLDVTSSFIEFLNYEQKKLEKEL